jgi:hypothetical protein
MVLAAFLSFEVAARPGASMLGVASWAQSCGAASAWGRAARPGARVCRAVRSVGWVREERGGGERERGGRRIAGATGSAREEPGGGWVR